MNRTIISKLAKLHFITPRGIYNLLRSIYKDGISLMALIRFASIYYPDKCALVSLGKRFTYKEMYDYSSQLAKLLYSDYALKAGMSVSLLCRNHFMVALLLPALSRLGVKVKMINTDVASCMVDDLVKDYNISLLIYDSELRDKLIPCDLPCKYKESEDLYNEIVARGNDFDLKIPHIKRGGEISVFTGGTSGKSKEVPRKMSINQLLLPFYALLEKLRIDEYDSVLLSLPMYHGFGLSVLVMSFLIGKKVCLMSHFEADQALNMVADEKIEVLPVVPAILARLWQNEEAPSLMKTVKCIICGGDRLDKKWVDTTNKHLGKVLFNLFGTSEAGFFMIASSDDLLRNEEVTIGRPIHGVKCKLENTDSQGVGSLWVRSGWAMMNMRNKWQATGDKVYRNADGYYFYRGRSDNMVVCGGENVYPENVEKIINTHHEVITSMVYPGPDPLFGTVLNAKVELTTDSVLTPEDLKTWLRPRLSRAEMPHDITINTINILGTGKIRRQ
ncbi:MAG: acyl--CoA ligase [Muribaculaceae bacterium]|nr:acyl--CoA ligase [Muribaculaceae bacterium]